MEEKEKVEILAAENENGIEFSLQGKFNDICNMVISIMRQHEEFKEIILRSVNVFIKIEEQEETSVQSTNNTFSLDMKNIKEGKLLYSFDPQEKKFKS